MTDTKTTEFSAELKALLVANEIPLQPIEWRDKEEEADKIRKAHREACREIFSQVQRVNSPSYALRIDAHEDIKGNPEHIAKLRELVATLEAEDAKLQAALASGLFKKAGEAQSAAWKRRDSMARLHSELRRDYDRLQYEASHRFTQALKELRDKGFVAKQSGKVSGLIEGVPAIWPEHSKGEYTWDFWYRGTHDTEGKLTPAGKALEATFKQWGIVFRFTTNHSGRERLRIFLSQSDSLTPPSLELINELGATLGYDKVEA